MATNDLRAQASVANSHLLAADVDDDTRQFYARMTFDISTFAIGAGLPASQDEAAQSLWNALTGPAAARAASWLQFYLQISRLVSGFSADTVSRNVRGEAAEALERLRQFLRENSDIVDATTIDEFKSATVRGAARA